MDLTTLTWLRSPAGTALLQELAARELSERDALGEMTRLRRSYVPEQARAAFELALLRKRAQAKFRSADAMFFTREALEQSSSEPVATHRAQRLQGYGSIADCCCGIGGDALAFAAAGSNVIAVDRDPLRLALVRANAEALGFGGQVSVLERDLLLEPPPAAEAIFCDPGRRAEGRRRFAVEEYEPPLSHILNWRERQAALAVKLAPGVDHAALPADAEIEFVSLNGELKEAVLWCGPLVTTARRASVLVMRADFSFLRYSLTSSVPSVINSTPNTQHSTLSHYLYEPDPAIIRAGLVTDLAAQIGAHQIDPEIAYLTAEERIETPFARAWQVHEWLPFSLKRLRARLRELDTGPVTVKKRGSPLDTDVLAKQLSGTGSTPWVVVLTMQAGKPIAVIAASVSR
jgi:SAM-dependent methyltransferase